MERRCVRRCAGWLLLSWIYLVGLDTCHGLPQAKSEAANLHKAYCGITCLYAALDLMGVETDFRELLKSEYIGSPAGSTLAELKNAADHCGLYTRVMKNLNEAALMASPHPMILHVRRATAMAKEYDHFELFLGTQDGRALIFDPPAPVRRVSFGELALRWDGTALIVSTTPIRVAAIIGPALRRLFLFAAAIAGSALLVRWATTRCVPEGTGCAVQKHVVLSLGQAAGLATLTVAFATVHHSVSTAGMLAHPQEVASLVDMHLGDFIPRLEEPQVRRLLARPGVVLIDARFRWDYGRAHIDGALSLPVNAPDDKWQAVTADLSKESHIVVYCQSAECGFAERVAVRLVREGFSDVSVFGGGWVKWADENSNPHAASL